MNNKKDAVIIHGMRSCALAMRPFARSLEKRGIYRKIHLIDISSWTHRNIPRIYGEKNAAIVADRLESKMSRRSLTKTFDVFGHSNGGYVALFLQKYLTKGKIDFTFTIASPKGIPLADIDIPDSIRSKVVHFRGGVDGVPFGYHHNPGDGYVVITFPDEGHCSIHMAADRNGLADTIAWANGQHSPHLFVDEAHVIHLWPFCREDVGSRRFLPPKLNASADYAVCNGIHDASLGSIKAEKEYWDSVFSASKVSWASVDLYPISRLKKYVWIRFVLNEHLERVKSGISCAKMYGKELKNELGSLEAQNESLNKRVDQIDKRVEAFYVAARRKHKLKLDRAIHPLNVARSVCEALDDVNDVDLNGITALLTESAREFEGYFQGSMVKSIGGGNS